MQYLGDHSCQDSSTHSGVDICFARIHEIAGVAAKGTPETIYCALIQDFSRSIPLKQLLPYAPSCQCLYTNTVPILVGKLVFTYLHSITRGIVTHLYTALLFTWTDYKTIFFPITAFACATAPVHSIRNLVDGWIWLWAHQLLCNVSNQANGSEDAMNKPWRPLPSGRITQSQIKVLRWVVVLACILLSTLNGADMVLVSLALTAVTTVYDEFGLSGHPFGKNACALGGYMAIELGTTKIMGRELDTVSKSAVVISGLLILTTIHAQDFADVEADAASGRVTFPIYAPRLSRLVTLTTAVAWSLGLSWYWKIGPTFEWMFIAMGTAIGLRYFFYRTRKADQLSYILFNVWLMAAHVLPLNARNGPLAC
ncbi:hypothetical protein WOLCODRAFT_79171 [Wolfiporia cocos MD-104 SS10]|uniref:UbiA prenyltransferase n=1 Tax=Wolfiporia cocos (strain MD-104) TaxID=742152 RepID=A0A2H3JDU7_WOLCO|nr:hypothetical protein WOLCODRAFT_79171 [Wolfiporia cocos MD-104 SS10]